MRAGKMTIYPQALEPDECVPDKMILQKNIRHLETNLLKNPEDLIHSTEYKN